MNTIKIPTEKDLMILKLEREIRELKDKGIFPKYQFGDSVLLKSDVKDKIYDEWTVAKLYIELDSMNSIREFVDIENNNKIFNVKIDIDNLWGWDEVYPPEDDSKSYDRSRDEEMMKDISGRVK